VHEKKIMSGLLVFVLMQPLTLKVNHEMGAMRWLHLQRRLTFLYLYFSMAGPAFCCYICSDILSGQPLKKNYKRNVIGQKTEPKKGSFDKLHFL
jgi:hypothetical protein